MPSSSTQTMRPFLMELNHFFEQMYLVASIEKQLAIPPSYPCSPSIHSDITSDRNSSIFDRASQGEDDASSVTSVSINELPVNLAFIDNGYDSAEEADDDDYLDNNNTCRCSDCTSRNDRIAHQATIPVADGDQSDPVFDLGTRALSNNNNDNNDTLPPHPARRGPSPDLAPTPLTDPASIGLGHYKPWPLPIGAGRPSRSPVQGQKTRISNVTIPVTPKAHAPVGDLESISISLSGWENFRFHCTPPICTSWQYTNGVSASLRDDNDEVVGARGMRVHGQSWAF